MIQWIRKKLGYHVCEEFTQWKVVVRHYTRPVDYLSDHLVDCNQTVIEYSRRYQIRQCTLCGYTQQEQIDQ